MAETPGSGPPSGPEPPSQRRWQAPCPNCGAPVSFVSAASAVAVCGYCKSTVVREGEALRKIGESSTPFDDHSPLQLGAGGRHAGMAFTLVGRLQYAYSDTRPVASAEPAGTWTEWWVLFDDGRHAWLSEDNDQYVLVFDVDGATDLPPASALSFDRPLRLANSDWSLASLVSATPRAAEGELPFAPPSAAFPVADLRNVQGQVATLEYRPGAPPQLSIGQAVLLGALELRGLRSDPGAGIAQVQARSFACPACGAPVSVALQSTQSITCGSCHSIVDMSQGIGGELSAVRQNLRHEPKIPLGRTGDLTVMGLARPWQVVGFAVHLGNPGNASEGFSWQDYLLYNEKEGFAFLIDSSEGWVAFRTLTGVPAAAGPRAVQVDGVPYLFRETYPAQVIFVEGEFYWKVDTKTVVQTSDFAGAGANAPLRLSKEQTENEVVWSRGRSVAAAEVTRAFRLTPLEAARVAADSTPVSGAKLKSWFIILILIIFILVLMAECSTPGPSTYYGTSGGSFGGYSSGGGHK